MKDRSKNKFTLKIICSYLVLGILLTVSALYIRSEIKTYIAAEKDDESDLRFIKTGSIFTQLYEAESLSKLALQTKDKTHFTAYAQKVDSVLRDIDTLKQLAAVNGQRKLLDSVQTLLKQKVANGKEFRNLKGRAQPNAALDQVLNEFQKMEASLGKITAEGLAPNINSLSPKAQKVIREVANYLNENIPEESKDNVSPEKIDSILNVSKLLLTKAKLENFKAQQSLAEKEIQLNRYDMELSHQLHQIITALEQEIVTNTYNDAIKKRTAFRRGIRFAGFTAIIGLLIVGLFTFLISRDFWKVQQYRQQLEGEKQFSESLLKSREQLISTVSHDLRTPLNTISGYGELLANTTLNDKQFHYLRHMTSASHYVDNLVNDLLDYSKLEAGQLHVEKIPFIFSDIILEAAENMKSLYSKKPIELFLAIDPRLYHRVIGDPFRIRQLLDNLIGNAYKFTSKGEIHISASLKQESEEIYQSIVTIKDTGIGIKKEKQNLIFKEFTQADAATEKKYGGYGLGLTISKKLATLLQGSLRLESKEGEGSTFMIALPLGIPKVEKINSHTKKTTSNFSILILDDDPALLNMLKAFCEAMSLQVHAFSDFNTIPHSNDLIYHVILTDIQMPSISGFEVLQQLQLPKYKHYQNQPIIAMTGRRDITEQRYLQTGFVGVLQKPFQHTSLIALLQKIFPEEVFSHPTNSVIRENETKRVFNIALISSFLDGNRTAIKEILQTFYIDSKQNLEEIEGAIEIGDVKKVGAVAHRMLPMFRQTEAVAIIPILEKMEGYSEGQSMSTEMKQTVNVLRNKMEVFMEAISSYTATHPDCND